MTWDDVTAKGLLLSPTQHEAVHSMVEQAIKNGDTPSDATWSMIGDNLRLDTWQHLYTVTYSVSWRGKTPWSKLFTEAVALPGRHVPIRTIGEHLQKLEAAGVNPEGGRWRENHDKEESVTLMLRDQFIRYWMQWVDGKAWGMIGQMPPDQRYSEITM